MTAPLIDLGGRTALVTGAGQGVGRATALTLAAHGAGTVVVNDFHLERAEQVAAEVEKLGVRALPVRCDVTDHAAVSSMVAQVSAEAGTISVLVNNAGNAGAEPKRGRPAPFWETGPDDWRPWLAVNLDGVMNCTSLVLGAMVEQGWGRVVTVISDAGRVGEAQLVPYSAAKAGAAGLTRALAKAVGQFGVTVNNVALGAMATPATAKAAADPELMRKVLRAYSVKRIGQPEDPAGLIAFLASDAGSWITGQTYPVNGGYSTTQ